MTRTFRIRTITTAAIVGVIFAGCYVMCGAPWYWSPPVTGTVVDEVTQQPISGAAVAVVWNLYSGNDQNGFVFHSAETVTARDGTFTISGWGPKARPPLNYVAHREPEIYVYKFGYQAAFFTTEQLESTRSYGIGVRRRPKIVSPWSGRALLLSPAKTDQQHCTAISSFYLGIDSPRQTDPEMEALFPRSLQSLRDGARRIPATIRKGQRCDWVL